jgi:hypothetical protein
MGWPVCVFPDNAMAAVPVLSCTDCVFWCGRCKEPTTKGKASINRLASSMACERFSAKALSSVENKLQGGVKA